MERRISSLSKNYSGIILPYGHFGTPLDNNNNTIHEELKLKNFEHAGEILAKFWSKLVINDHPVVVKFIGKDSLDIAIAKSEGQKTNHVREL